MWPECHLQRLWTQSSTTHACIMSLQHTHAGHALSAPEQKYSAATSRAECISPSVSVPHHASHRGLKRGPDLFCCPHAPPCGWQLSCAVTSQHVQFDIERALSAPERKYSAATSSAECVLPSASVKPRMPPPTVSGTNTPSEVCLNTCIRGHSAAADCSCHPAA